MADLEQKFNAADQTIAFTLTWFCVEVLRSPQDTQLFKDVLRDALGLATSDHPVMGPMIAAAHDVIEQIETGNPALGRARGSAEAAVAQFARWRAGRSYDVFRQQYRGDDPIPPAQGKAML